MLARFACLLTALSWAASAAAAEPGPLDAAAMPPSGSIHEAEWGVHLFGGVSAGRSRLIELVPFPWNGDYGGDYLVAGAVSRQLMRIDSNWTIDGEIGAGYRFRDTNAPEVWTALYFRYEGFPWNRVVYTTVAVSTGLSYISTVPEGEKRGRGGPHGSKLLHYFSPEITFAHPDRRDTELVVRFHHRSGVFGLFNGVWGGSNVVTGGIRQRF